MSSAALKAPFPYFGGKSTVADVVWLHLGDVRNYIEPFFGSGAVLLRRPHEPKIETINDADCYVANFWRATRQDPEGVVDHCDWPVNEADLHARHRWLVLSDEAAAFRERMRANPDYYDVRVAGWWVWGLCQWIGGGWCTFSDGPDRKPNLAGDGRGNGMLRGPKQQMPDTAGVSHGKGVHRKRPSLGDANGGAGAKGVHQRRPLLSVNTDGVGVHRQTPATWNQRPDISDGGGRGVLNTRLPQIADQFSRGRGVHANDTAGTCAQRRAWLLDWFAALQDRLRVVRVCCGDWQRVCGSRSVTTRIGVTGVFLDPPYALSLERMHAWVRHLSGEGDPPPERKGKTSRDGGIYASDRGADVDRLVAEVHLWCREWGQNPDMRIVLCGYEGEHDSLVQMGWSVHEWATQGGYGNRGEPNTNKTRERMWISPHCLQEETTGLFGKEVKP